VGITVMQMADTATAVTEHWSVTHLSHLQSCTLVPSLADPAEPTGQRDHIVSHSRSFAERLLLLHPTCTQTGIIAFTSVTVSKYLLSNDGGLC